jgi:tripartite-type tricarboxylate transporter receptor subunit TctC
VTPLSPGTTIDILARLFADRLARRLAQPVVVANRAGAAGAVAGQAVLAAGADGHTLLFTNSGHPILGVLNKSATIIADLIGGRIHAAFVPAAFILPMLEDHRLAGLAVSAREPISAPVSVPTAISQGISYEYETWYGILAPARTPKPILHLLHEAISALAKEQELLAKIRAQGIDPKDIGLADFDAYIRNEMVRLAPLLRTITAER